MAHIDAVTPPVEQDDNKHVYHLYVVQVPDRDGLREYLDQHEVGTGIHYPTPAHEHPAVVERCGKTTRESAERISDRIVSLPMHPRITEAEIDKVCSLIEEYYEA